MDWRQVLVDRLAMRHLHLLAVRVCEHLRLRRDRVAVHWACRKIVKACSGGGAPGSAGVPTDEELTRVRRYHYVRNCKDHLGVCVNGKNVLTFPDGGRQY